MCGSCKTPQEFRFLTGCIAQIRQNFSFSAKKVKNYKNPLKIAAKGEDESKFLKPIVNYSEGSVILCACCASEAHGHLADLYQTTTNMYFSSMVISVLWFESCRKPEGWAKELLMMLMQNNTGGCCAFHHAFVASLISFQFDILWLHFAWMLLFGCLVVAMRQ